MEYMNVKLTCLITALKQNHKNTHMVINACSVITVAHFGCLMTNIRKILSSFVMEITELC